MNQLEGGKPEETLDYADAVKRAREKSGFIQQLAWYAIVNILLLVINLLTSPDQLWFYWVTIFWGLGLAMQGLRVLQVANDFEQRMIEREIEREKRRRSRES